MQVKTVENQRKNIKIYIFKALSQTTGHEWRNNHNRFTNFESQECVTVLLTHFLPMFTFVTVLLKF